MATKVVTTAGDVQEIYCGENMTRDAFYSLMRQVVPNITNAQLKEYYETYKASPNVYAVGVTGLAAGAEENGLTGKGKQDVSEGKTSYGKSSENLARKSFKNPSLLEEHYTRHGQEIADVLGDSNYSIDKYLDDANYIINNGEYVPELNGYVSSRSGKKYGFVGLDRTTGEITTFHVKNISELIKKAPSLGFGR